MRPCLPMIVLAASLAFGGCAQIQAQMPAIPQALANGGNPNPQPPPVPPEVRPQPPVSEDPLMWQPGHWDWSGTGYVWVSGKWIDRAGHGTTWQDGYWSNAGGSWAWIPAHWL